MKTDWPEWLIIVGGVLLSLVGLGSSLHEEDWSLLLILPSGAMTHIDGIVSEPQCRTLGAMARNMTHRQRRTEGKTMVWACLPKEEKDE